MASLLSLVSDVSSFLNVFSEVYNKEQFTQFYKNIRTDKYQYIHQLLKNVLYLYCDSIAEEIIEDERFIKILENKNYSKIQNVKIYCGEATKTILNKFSSEVIDEEIIKDLITLVVTNVPHFLNINTIESGIDIYEQIIDGIHVMLYPIILNLISAFVDKEFNSCDVNVIMKELMNILNKINDIYNYTPIYADTEEFDSDEEEEEFSSDDESRKRRRDSSEENSPRKRRKDSSEEE